MDQVGTDELIDLENRVALAQRLFPSEAQVGMDIAQMKGTSEFTMSSLEHDGLTGAKRTSSGLKRKQEKIIEEYQTRLKDLIKTDMSHLSIPTPEAILEEYQYQTKLRELSKTVELGKRFFPRCSAYLYHIMNCEDLNQLVCGEVDTSQSEIGQQKKKRCMEIQEILMKFFSEDKKELRNSSLTASTCSSTASCF